MVSVMQSHYSYEAQKPASAQKSPPASASAKQDKNAKGASTAKKAEEKLIYERKWVTSKVMGWAFLPLNTFLEGKAS